MSRWPRRPRAAAPRGVGATGVLLAAAGAISYGVATVLGRHLAHSGVDSATALGVRFAIAAACLAALLRVRGIIVRPAPRLLVQLFLLGAIGYAFESTLFYLALERGTTAACILLFYAYPAIVTAIELARGREPPRAVMFVALGLSLVGVAAVVATGNEVSIETAGVLLALGSAAGYALYLLVGRGMGHGVDAMIAACWVAVGASAISFARGVGGGSLESPGDHWLALVAYGASTAAAFGLTFASLSRIGPSSTSVVMTLEAVSAVILAALFLGEEIGLGQAAGGVAIVVAAALIARSHRDDDAEAPLAADQLGEPVGPATQPLTP